MKTEYKIAVLGGIALSFIALTSYFSKQANLLKDACYTVTGAIINEMSFNRVSFTMLLNIANKSDIDLTVNNQRYNIYINKMLVAKVEKKEKVKVRARGKTTVNIDVKFNPQDLLKKGMENISYLITNKDKLIIEIKGYLSLNAGVVKVKDYEVDERLSMKELLSPAPKTEKC